MRRKPVDAPPQQWAAAERMISVVLMRQAGYSLTAIGTHFGISPERVRRVHMTALKSRVVKWCWQERMMAFNHHLRRKANGRKAPG